MSLVIHPTYFPNILFFSKILNQDKILFEVNDNYIKQSLRNRTSIYHANGILNLSIIGFTLSNGIFIFFVYLLVFSNKIFPYYFLNNLFNNNYK